MKHFILVSCISVLLLTVSACSGTKNAREINDSKASNINVQLGMAYMKQGNNVRAMEKLKRALEQDPLNPKAHSAIGLLYTSLKQFTEADGHFKKAVKLDPADSQIRNNYGTYLCGIGKIDEAEQEFLYAVKNPLYQTPEYAYTNAGLCMKRKPDMDKAEQYLRKALTLNPKFSVALLQMANLSYEKKRYLSARAYIQRYTEVTRHNASSLWLSIRTEMKLGGDNKVSSQSLLLKSKFPDSEETRLLLEMEENDRKSGK
jgi:type IV pilus assembly protein PilF